MVSDGCEIRSLTLREGIGEQNGEDSILAQERGSSRRTEKKFVTKSFVICTVHQILLG
jgi:hypothetical protein